MNRIILVSLPILALLGCGDSKKKEKSVPADNTVVTAAGNTTTDPVTGDSKDDVPSVSASPQSTTTTPATTTPATTTPATTTPATTTPATDSGKGSDGSGKGGDNAGQNPGTDGKDNNPADCDVHVLDFDKKPDGKGFVLGEKVLEQYRAWGVRIESYKKDQNNGYSSTPAVIFDSAASANDALWQQYAKTKDINVHNDFFDADLTTSNNHNVLIIAEQTYNINPKDTIDRVTYPDDNAFGGKIKLFFDKQTKVMDMEFVSNESDSSTVELFDNQADNAKPFATQSIPRSEANVSRKLTVDNKEYTRKFKILLNGCGAVDNIRICVQKAPVGK